MRLIHSCLAFAAILALCCSSAFAEIQLTARGAAGVPTDGFNGISSPSPLIAGDLTYGMGDYFQVGATYEHNFLKASGSSATFGGDFFGGIARMSFATSAFADFQAGIYSENGSGNSFSWGAGLGYAMPLSPLFDFSPRFGYRSLPVGGGTQSMVDFGVMLTLKLF